MIKKVIARVLLGFPCGVCVGDIVNMCISAAIGDGGYTPAMPVLVSSTGGELTAVLVQFLLTGLIGVVFAVGSLIFESERISFWKQCILHFLLTAVFYTPFVYLCWMPKNLTGVGILLVNMAFTYFITYIIQYSVELREVKRINKYLEERTNADDKD